jgi:hypothetical protein
MVEKSVVCQVCLGALLRGESVQIRGIRGGAKVAKFDKDRNLVFADEQVRVVPPIPKMPAPVVPVSPVQQLAVPQPVKRGPGRPRRGGLEPIAK